MSKKDNDSKSPKTTSEIDDSSDPSSLPGWPGYRTRGGRSGLDPIDTRSEAGHTFGILLQNLFTGRLRIRNPIYLFLWGVLGLVLISPLIIAILDRLNGSTYSWNAWVILLITGAIGIALLVNIVKNLIRILK